MCGIVPINRAKENEEKSLEEVWGEGKMLGRSVTITAQLTQFSVAAHFFLYAKDDPA